MTARGITVILLGVFMAVAGFFLVRWQQHLEDHHRDELTIYAGHSAEGHHAELDWLQLELGVDDHQLKKIQQLHVAYHPLCESLSQRLESSHTHLEKLTETSTSVSSEVDSALQTHAELHLECQRAMLKHIYDTASCLNAQQAQVYLKKMLPLVFVHDDLSASDHSH